MASCRPEPLRFAFLTDCHYSGGSRSGADLGACIADINGLAGIDFVLFGGDLTNFGSDAEIHAVKAIIDSLRRPYRVVAGNHDAKWSESGGNTFSRVFGYDHFSFRRKGWRVLGCNSGPDMRMAPALVPRESVEWLKGLRGERRSIFINHYPQDTSVLNYSEATEELRRLGVRLVIGGHVHNNRTARYDGLQGILCRSTLADRNKDTGYNIFTVSRDGAVSVAERRRVDGAFRTLEPWWEGSLEPAGGAVEKSAATPPGAEGTACRTAAELSTESSAGPVREVWRIQEKANIASGFAVEGDRAFYATVSGRVNAVRLADGKRIWSRTFPGRIFSTPAVDGGKLVFGCADGNVYSLDASNGRTLWTFKARKSVLSSPVIFGGKVFIGASDGSFRALDLRDGSLAWSFVRVEGFVECRPWVDSSQVVFGAWDGKLYSLSPADGTLQWSWKTPRGANRMYSPAACWPVKAAGRIFVAVPDRKVYALDAGSGTVLFSVDGGRESVGLSADGSRVYAKTMFHHTYALAADVPVPSEGEAPEELWRVENLAGYDISPTAIAEAGGMVLNCSARGNLTAMDAQDGSLLWTFRVSEALLNPVAAYEKGGDVEILASSMDGAVCLLSAPIPGTK